MPEPSRPEEAMKRIEPEMRVATVVDRHPETVSVFLDYDCPDMRTGFFRLMSRMMSIRAAAWVHGIPVDELVRKLNKVAAPNGIAGGESEDEA